MLQASIWRGWSVGWLALRSRTAPPAWRGLVKPGHWAGGGLGHWDRFRCRAPALGSVGSGGRWLAGRRRPYGGQVGTLAAATACTCSRSEPVPGLAPPLCQTSFLTPLFFPSPPALFIDPSALLTASGEERKHSKTPLFLFSSSPPFPFFWVSHPFLNPTAFPSFFSRSELAILHHWRNKAGDSVTRFLVRRETISSFLLISSWAKTGVDFSEDNYTPF